MIRQLLQDLSYLDVLCLQTRVKRATLRDKGLTIDLQWRFQEGPKGYARTPSPYPVFKYPIKMNNLVSVRPNYFIFTGYLVK